MLTEQDEQRRWASLTEAARAQLTAVATSFLLDRELLRRPDHDGSVIPGTVNGIAATQGAQVIDLPMAPPLALITTARQCPVVVAAGTRPDGSTAGTNRACTAWVRTATRGRARRPSDRPGQRGSRHRPAERRA